MQPAHSIPEKTLTAILDREIYQVVFQNLEGDICLSGDRQLSHMNRDDALEAFREGDVLKVYTVNFIEGIVADVTDEIAGEIEFEQSQKAEREYIAPRVYRSLENAGRTL